MVTTTETLFDDDSDGDGDGDGGASRLDRMRYYLAQCSDILALLALSAANDYVRNKSYTEQDG